MHLTRQLIIFRLSSNACPCLVSDNEQQILIGNLPVGDRHLIPENCHMIPLFGTKMETREDDRPTFRLCSQLCVQRLCLFVSEKDNNEMTHSATTQFCWAACDSKHFDTLRPFAVHARRIMVLMVKLSQIWQFISGQESPHQNKSDF